MIPDDLILQRVQAIVAQTAGASQTLPEVGPDTPLGKEGFWLDSVDALMVILACEQEFGVAFDGADDLTAEALRSARNLAALIRRKLA